jgi:hypothetical protein
MSEPGKLRREAGRRFTPAVAAIVVLLVATSALAQVGSSRNARSIESIPTRDAGEAIVAIVSLGSQKITVYDADGWIMRAPVSSGQPGRETPAGIFSVIQKDANHHSNLYDDAFMPHMQRLTWSGIALHGGPLPGHPASHGCVRLPYNFATRLFDVTRLGMRVIVAPGDVEPLPIAHPILFRAPPAAPDAAAARLAEAEEATKKADLARRAVFTASRDFAQASMAVRRLSFLKERLEQQLADIEHSNTSQDMTVEVAEAAKAKLPARIADFERQLASAEADLRPKAIALADARQAVAAEVTRADVAEAAAKAAARGSEPVSAFVSRKTQRLYVRQGFQPVFDVPISLKDPDRPIGTHVFTAVKPAQDSSDLLQWNVVSIVGQHSKVGAAQLEPPAHQTTDASLEEASGAGPREALDRIVIPEDAVDRIMQMMSLRSSLIVSDEGPSLETGSGTEFVVVLSDEPQGGLASRPRR